jgi:hypothetical protein
MNNRSFHIALVFSVLVFAVLLMPACSYRFGGGGTLPGDVTSVHIETFSNRTAMTGFEITFTNNITYEFNRAQAIEVTTLEKAQSVFSGSIVRLLVETLARVGTTTVSQQRATLVVDLKLSDMDNQLLWVRKGFSDYEDYSVGADAQETRENQIAALDKLSRRMAENIYKALTSNF